MNFDLKNKKQLVMIIIIAILAVGSLYINVVKKDSDATNVAPAPLPTQNAQGPNTNQTPDGQQSQQNTDKDSEQKGPGGIIIKNSPTPFPGAGNIKNLKNNPFRADATGANPSP